MYKSKSFLSGQWFWRRGWRLKSSSFFCTSTCPAFFEAHPSVRWLNKEYLGPKVVLGKSIAQLHIFHPFSLSSSKTPSASIPIHQGQSTLTIQRLLSWWQMATEKITPDSKQNLCSLPCQTLYERLINLIGWFQPPHGCKEVAWNTKILFKESFWFYLDDILVLNSTLRNFLKHPKLLPTIFMHLDAQITCIARDRQGLPEWKGSSKSFKFHCNTKESTWDHPP